MKETTDTVPATGQVCSTNGCGNPAAYKTRSKPAWCTGCIDGILRKGGLRADEPFTGPKDLRLTTCLECGVQAHYKFEYTLEKNAQQEKTCRACHWTEWAQMVRQMSGDEMPRYLYSREEIISRLGKNGFDLVTMTGEANDGNDPVVTRCRSCGKRSAQRLGDVGCTCTRNTRAENPASKAASPGRNIRSTNPVNAKSAKVLFADSEDPARGGGTTSVTMRRRSGP